MKTSPPHEDLRTRRVMIRHPRLPDKGEAGEEEEEEEHARAQGVTDVARLEEDEGRESLTMPLMTKANTGEKCLPWSFMDLTGLVNHLPA